MEFCLQLPGSTSNLGPGFDALGLALTIYNRVKIRTRSDTRLTLSIEGEGKGSLPEDHRNLFFQSAKSAASKIGKSLPGLDVVMENNVPLARGLGSSSTVIVAGIMAANHLLGDSLSKAEVLDFANEQEGHPDNVSPCVYGGLTVSSICEGSVSCIRAQTPSELRAVVAIPDFEMQTKAARAAIPSEIPLHDATFNISRACLVTSALLTGNLSALRHGMQDRVHQPYRSPLIPGFDRVIEAALSAGALGGALSGAGPSLLAFATDHTDEIGRKMMEAWQAEGIQARAEILNIDPNGATLE